MVFAGKVGEDPTMIINSVEHIWDSTTVAVGDTAVLHCSFDALFQQLPHGNVSQQRFISNAMFSLQYGHDKLKLSQITYRH